jgi:hypothetical protein
MSCSNFFSGMPCSGHPLLLCFFNRPSRCAPTVQAIDVCYKLMSICELLIPFRHEIDARQANQSDEPCDQHIGPENGPNRCHG